MRTALPIRLASQGAGTPQTADEAKPLSRLRNLQRSVLRRRTRIAPTEQPPAYGAELAEALFPQASRVRTENSEKQDTTSADMPEGGHGVQPNHLVAGRCEGPIITCQEGPDASIDLSARQHTQTRRNVLKGSSVHTDCGADTTHVQRHVSSQAGTPGEGSQLKSTEDEDGSTTTENWRLAAARRPMANGAEDQSAPASKPNIGSGSGDGDLGAMFVKNGTRKLHLPDIVSAKKSSVPVVRVAGTLPWKGFGRGGNLSSRIGTVDQDVLPLVSAFETNFFMARQDSRLPRMNDLCKTSGHSQVVTTVKANGDAVLKGLNTSQRAAVLADRYEACIVLAGPGSGKTRVLTHRIAYLVKEFGVSPFQILALSFTNKAAQEMKERVSKILQMQLEAWATDGGSRLGMGTFHSICAQILRKHGSQVGVAEDFVICDASDARQVVSRLLKEHEGIAPDSSKVGELVSMISRLKHDRDGNMGEILPRPLYRRIVQFKVEYDTQLRSMKQLDFDDLLLETRELLERSPQVLKRLQNAYQYVLVDEWQDTNRVQFDIVSLLAGRHQNLFVVGDADQSIYKFRGANSGNVAEFTNTFPNATEIILERNYRSSGCIVAASQAVIEGNLKRQHKRMSTLNEFGEKVVLRETAGDKQEALFVVSTLKDLVRSGAVSSVADVAIMYRTNSQSRLLEECCILEDIPYRLLSGTKFYDRREVRDLVAYLRVLSNTSDDNAFRRIANTPPRRIGKKTLDTLESYSQSRRVSLRKGLDQLLEAFLSDESVAQQLNIRKNTMKSLVDLHSVLSLLQKKSDPYIREMLDDNENETVQRESVDSLLEFVIKQIKYREYLQNAGENESRVGGAEKAAERIRNVDELVRAASRFSSLSGYLDSVTLMTEASDRQEESTFEDPARRAAVSLTTLHGGKGLEFEAVFITGAEDNTIPFKSPSDEEDLEEERRLLYVGMTRAKRLLFITWRAKKLMLQGGKAFSRDSVGPSRFLKVLPPELVNGYELMRNRNDGDQ